MTLKERMELRIPVAHEVSTALLHPPIKVARCNLVGKIQNGVLRLKNFDRSFLDAYTSIAVSHGIRSVMAGIECVRTGVVLQDQRSPTRDEIEQLPILDSHIGADVVGADTHHDGVKTRELDRSQVGRRNYLDANPKLRQTCWNLIACSHNVPDAQSHRNIHVYGAHVEARRTVVVKGVEIRTRNDVESFA